LIGHYEDICAYFPNLAEELCNGLRLDMSEHGLINDVNAIFSEIALEPIPHIHRELPEWSVPIPIEINPEETKDITGYPRSPDMSRDNSTGTTASEGPITPDTHPIHVADDIPEVVLDHVKDLAEKADEMKITGPVNSGTTLSAFSSRIARVLGSTGSFFR
jgi:hypothetical protein